MRRTLALIIASLFINGCSFLNPKIEDSVPSEIMSAADRQSRLLEITDWEMQGRITIKTSTDGANASLVWEQQDDRSVINIFGAFGTGSLRIIQKPGAAVLFRSGEKTLYGENAEELLLWETGLKVPLRNLASWIRGLPGDAIEPQYDAYGRLRSLQYVDEHDNIWAATFERYREVNGYELPVRVSVKGGDYQIKLTTEKWDAEGSEADGSSKRLQIPGKDT